jgi:VanZ family protein
MMPRPIVAVAAHLNRPRARSWLAWGWTALVLALMWLPSVKSPPSFLGELTDKAGHLGVFGVLSALWLRALHNGDSPAHALRIALVGGLAFSLVTELGQGFVPGREVALGDLVANWLGVGLGSAVAAYSLRPRQT